MKINSNRFISVLSCIIFCLVIITTVRGNGHPAGGKQFLINNWQLQSSYIVKDGGKEISSSDYQAEKWYKTTIPTTVLSALVKKGVYPDPRNGLDCYLIPDASIEFNKKYDLEKFSHLPNQRNPWLDAYWYRTEFMFMEFQQGQHIWLNFNCINYRAEVWVNGKLIVGKEEMAGMFQRFRFDVTTHIKQGKNVLAIKIFPVDHPGIPEKQVKVFGDLRGYGGEIYRDVTENMTIGYDCMMTVPDRNMGICQEVYIDWTGPVDIRNPFVITDLPLPDTSRAELTISTELYNNSSKPVKGILRGIIAKAELKFEKSVELEANETKTVYFDKKPLIENPLLWWPINYGRQYLYDLDLTFEENGRISNTEKITFGVREITSTMHKLDGWYGRRIHINGKKIFCRGGFIQPELLLDWEKFRIHDVLRYFADANMNLIYFEDIPNPPDDFLDECDRLGILFGNDFYGAGWIDVSGNYPDDLNLLKTCTIDLLKRYRNHPSLIMYMALNEHTPREQVYVMWRKLVQELDGTRFWIPSGHFADNRKDVPEWIKADLPVGMNDYGGTSYRWKEPVTYFKWVREDRSWMFKMESGSASLPPISSLAKFIPDLGTIKSDNDPFPLTPTWAHHGANGYYYEYDAAIRRLFGEPESVADYCWQGHLVTADQHRAFYEAVNHRMWDITSGFTEWKINSAFPDVQWQNFDYYLKPGISHFYIKRACEPLHIQLNLIDNMVSVINTRLNAQSNLNVRAEIYDLNSKLLWEQNSKTDVSANSYKEIFNVPYPLNATDVFFVKLELIDAHQRLISENFYWLRNKDTEDYKALHTLTPVKPETEYRVETVGEEILAHIKISNQSKQISFFTQLALTNNHGNEILPVFWEDNYFSLLPGETREITAKLSAKDAGSGEIKLEVGGWNVQSSYQCSKIELSKNIVNVGEELTATVKISNTFLDGSRVWLLVDGKTEQSKWAWARNGKSVKLPFKVRFIKPGKHELSIGSIKTEVRVK